MKPTDWRLALCRRGSDDQVYLVILPGIGGQAFHLVVRGLRRDLDAGDAVNTGQ